MLCFLDDGIGMDPSKFNFITGQITSSYFLFHDWKCFIELHFLGFLLIYVFCV